MTLQPANQRHELSTTAPGRVLALIPAHNEEALVAAAIAALEAQTSPVDRILVVSDNSTDRTPEIARTWGGRVSLFETHGNRDRKAGALNQALSIYMPWLDEDDFILVMDADSEIVPGFVARARRAMAADPNVGAVGGIFLAEEDGSLLGKLQALEYTRYAREIARDRGRAKVLTGTATFARVSALRDVVHSRDTGRLPGEPGVYNLAALCEDFELTLALKHLGRSCLSPKECVVRTEVMPTLPMLWRQRTRWQRGALQCLRFYGLTRRSFPYIVQQASMSIGLLAMTLLMLVTLSAALTGTLEVQPLWVAVGGIFWVERLVSAWRAGWAGRLLAAAMLPDTLYDLFIGIVTVGVWVQVALGRDGQWGLATIDQGAN